MEEFFSRLKSREVLKLKNKLKFQVDFTPTAYWYPQKKVQKSVLQNLSTIN